MILKRFKQTLSDSSIFLIIFGFIYFHSSLIWWSILASWIFCNCVSLIVHEGWGHQYVTPKNRYVGYVLDIVGYLGMPLFAFETQSRKIMWKVLHKIHHIHWKESLDYSQWDVDHNSTITYLFFPFRTNHMRQDMFYDKIADKVYNKVYLGMDTISRFLDYNRNKIVILIHILSLVCLGLEYYFYFVFVPTYSYDVYHRYFGEVLAHKGKQTKDADYDIPWLFFICTSIAYHKSHHQYPELNLGPKWVKYFNIQYYFTKLFFRINPAIPLS